MAPDERADGLRSFSLLSKEKRRRRFIVVWPGAIIFDSHFSFIQASETAAGSFFLRRTKRRKKKYGGGKQVYSGIKQQASASIAFVGGLRTRPFVAVAALIEIVLPIWSRSAGQKRRNDRLDKENTLVMTRAGRTLGEVKVANHAPSRHLIYILKVWRALKNLFLLLSSF